MCDTERIHDWPVSSYGSPHKYAYVHYAHDGYREGIGRNPSPLEIILYEAMVDVRLWQARTVYTLEGRYGTKVSGPHSVRGIVIRTENALNGFSPYLELYRETSSRIRTVRTHICYADEADAIENARMNTVHFGDRKKR